MIRYLTLITLFFLPSLARAEGPCSRIVSLAPSVTETLFSVDLGERVVGVTRYCTYPKEARAIQNIGGFYDINIETIVALRPDIVVGLPEHEASMNALRRLGVQVTTVDHSTIAGIKESIKSLGERCGAQSAASRELASLTSQEQELSRKYQRASPLRTLVAVGRTHEGDAVSGVYVSGKDGFYSSVLPLIGMRNVNDESTISLPTLSPEGLLALQPDAIVEIVGQDDPARVSHTRSFWERYPKLSAVANKRIVILTSDYAAIPGPRYVRLAEDIAHAMGGEGAR